MLDHILASLLIVVIPARALWRSHGERTTDGPKTRRYRATIGLVAALLAVLAIDWIVTGRTLALLGLSAPVTPAAMLGLAIAAAILIALSIAVARKRAAFSADRRAPDDALLPETAAERRWFVGLAVAAGCGWEILYRGFLLSYLTSQVGLAAAVAISALAYGAAHGVKTWRRFAGSIAAAIALTIGYAVSGSLWWLMLLHTGLPLLGLTIPRPPHTAHPAP